MSYLGIDLGTTNTVGIIYNDKLDELESVKIEGIDEILPSVVNLLEDEIIVGVEAKESAVIYPTSTITSIKRLMGSNEKVIVDNMENTPEEISSYILKTIKESAEEQANEVFDEVVITHPAYFNDKQIVATKEAGRLAGFTNVYLLAEPLAAAIEYGYKQRYAQTILVYDLGGGTFDACVLKVSKNEDNEEIYKELANVGNMNLGGDDFDFELIKYFKSEFEKQNGINVENLSEVNKAMVSQKLKQEAENAKKKLSTTNRVVVNISPLVVIEGVPKNLEVEITKEQFEDMIRGYIEKSKEIIEEVLLRSGKEAKEIDKVILVGGSTLIPMVRRVVAGFIKEPYSATDPAKSVAMGASIYNYLIHLPNSSVKVGQITRQIFGTSAIINRETKEKALIPIIPLGTSIPCAFQDDKFTNFTGTNIVYVDIFQWEQGYEDEKKYIGTLSLDNVEGESQFEITYQINEDNIFGARVIDKNSGQEAKAQFDRTVEVEYKEREMKESLAIEDLNVVFCIDTTGSMENYILGVKDKAKGFSEILEEKGINYNLGLIGFGDLNEREKPKVYNFTDSIETFKANVNKLPRYYGGAIPESSFDALETATELFKSGNKNSKNILILITDAEPHIPTKSGKYTEDIKNMLELNDITTFVVSKTKKECVESYTPLILPTGKYFSMRDNFENILDNIAQNITELVRM